MPILLQHRPCILVAVLLAAVATQICAAPDEAALGAGKGYPSGDRSNWLRQEHLVGAFTAMDRLFPAPKEAAGPAAHPLTWRPASPDWPFIQAYLDQHPATGLLLLKDGQILVERYQHGRWAEDRFTSFSMAKKVVAMAEGQIASIEEPVDRIEPALAGTAWKGVTLQQVLQMASGVRFDENSDKPGTDIARLSCASTLQQGSLLAALHHLTEHDTAPGERLRYVCAETQVLTQVLVRASGRPLADYVSEKIWAPMGAEANAAWAPDAAGTEAGCCCLSARLRDWARVGQLLLDGGQRGGKQVIPRPWIDAATTMRAQDGHLSPRRATPHFGYGYQTGIFPESLGFALLRVGGQAVFVHPRLRLVMVQAAVWPASSDTARSRERDRSWRDFVQVPHKSELGRNHRQLLIGSLLLPVACRSCTPSFVEQSSPSVRYQ